MVIGFYYCCDFLYTAAVVWFLLTVAGAVWKPRVGERARKSIWFTAIIVVAGLIVYNNYMTHIVFSKVSWMVFLIMLSLISIFIYSCRYRDAFCLIYLFWSVLALTDFFFQTLIYTLREGIGLQPDILLTVTISRGAYLLLWVLVLSGTTHFVHRLGRKKLREMATYLKQGWLFVPLLFGCMVYFQRIYKQLVSEQLMYRWWVFLLGGLLMIIIILAYLTVQREKERYWLLQQKTGMLEYDYRAMQKIYQEKEILLHDFRKHMLVIREMVGNGEEKEIIHYLDEMDQVMQKGRNQNLVNHEMLDLILSRYFQEAEKAGVSVQYELDDMGSLLLKPIEICALFSNILDNAIEANQAVAEDSKRWIKLSCTRKERMLIISVSNPLPEGKLTFVGEIPQTTKKDKGNHGLGMRSIRQVVEAHNGNMQIEVTGGIFKLVVCMERFRL